MVRRHTAERSAVLERMIGETSMRSDAYKQEGPIELVVVIPLPMLPDDPQFARALHTDTGSRFWDECEQVARANISSILLVNEHSFPFSDRLSPRDVAFVMKLLLELRRKFQGMRIGIDLVDDAEATFAVATTAECDFVRVRVAGPYDGLTTVQRPELRKIRELVYRAGGDLETWVALSPWGEKLSGEWTLSEFSASVIESVAPSKVTVPFGASGDVVDSIGVERVVFDGGVGLSEFARGPGTYVMGSALRNGQVSNSLDVSVLSELSKRHLNRT